MRLFGKRLAVFTLLLTMLLSASTNVKAAEDGINSIDVTAKLAEDGSASITEIWSVNNAYSGTEYYIPIYNSENMTVSNLSVSDESGNVYEFVDSWDTSLSFEEKAYKCGILQTSDGYEICWGISQYGDKTFTVSYEISSLVKSYSDKDGFYYQFITYGLSSPPDSASVTIYMDGISFSESNAQIWAMGFEGEIWFENGSIVAYSTDNLGSDDYVNVLCGFEKGIFSATTASGSFEDLEEEALDEIDPVEVLLIIAVVLLLVIVIVGVVYLASRDIKLADGSKVRRLSEKKTQMVSTIPFNGSIQMTFTAMLMGPSYSVVLGSPIAAFLTRWEMDGVIKYDAAPSKKLQYKQDGEPVIYFTERMPNGSSLELQLLDMLKSAADSSMLRLSQWEKWISKRSKKIEKWQEALKTEGEYMLVNCGYAEKNANGRIRFTAAGFDMATEMIGFYRYLKSFKGNNADIDVEKEYWGEILVFASLFNMTESVVMGLYETYDDDFDDFAYGYGMNYLMFINFMNYGHSFSDSAVVHTSEGAGGGSSSSGGGGFSGGGGGGGSR